MDSERGPIKLKNLQILKVDKKFFNGMLIKREFEHLAIITLISRS